MLSKGLKSSWEDRLAKLEVLSKPNNTHMAFLPYYGTSGWQTMLLDENLTQTLTSDRNVVLTANIIVFHHLSNIGFGQLCRR